MQENKPADKKEYPFITIPDSGTLGNLAKALNTQVALLMELNTEHGQNQAVIDGGEDTVLKKGEWLWVPEDTPDDRFGLHGHDRCGMVWCGVTWCSMAWHGVACRTLAPAPSVRGCGHRCCHAARREGCGSRGSSGKHSHETALQWRR